MEASTPTEPVVLLIGTVDREGVVSAVKSAGLRYSVKRIDSAPKNWKSICALFAENTVTCAVLKLTPTTYRYLGSESYTGVRDELLTQVAKSRHAVYVYEDLYSGAQKEGQQPPQPIEDFVGEQRDYEEFLGEMISREEFERHYFNPPDDHVREFVNALLTDRGIEIVPYRNNAELSVLASKFIADADGGLLFRVYLPSDRIWANETDRLLTLFRDYLCNVGHQRITLNQTRTTHGVIYEFFAARDGDGSTTSQTVDLSSRFDQFSRLLDLCLSDSEQAGKLLQNHGVSAREITTILTRYAKEAKRLQIDLRHEREQKVLSIRQRLEAELVDELPAQVPCSAIIQLVDAAIPPITSLSAALTVSSAPLQLTTGEGSSLVVNLRPQIVNSVNAIVAQEVNGGVHLTKEDNQILQLVREHASEHVLELESAVRQVADESVAKPERILSARRLKGFLIQLAAKVPDIGAGLLQAYLEKRLGL
jgi:hypothetical protein